MFLEYEGWWVAILPKEDKITLRCFPENPTTNQNFIDFHYLYQDVVNEQGAIIATQHQLDVLNNYIASLSVDFLDDDENDIIISAF